VGVLARAGRLGRGSATASTATTPSAPSPNPEKQPAIGPADEQQPKHELRLAQVGNDRELVKKVSIDNQGPNQLFDSPDCRAAQGILALKPPTAWDSDKEPAPLSRRLSTRR